MSNIGGVKHSLQEAQGGLLEGVNRTAAARVHIQGTRKGLNRLLESAIQMATQVQAGVKVVEGLSRRQDDLAATGRAAVGRFIMAVGVEDAQNPKAVEARDRARVMITQMRGDAPVGATNIPATLVAIAEDAQFIDEQLAIIRALGESTLTRLTTAGDILDAAQGTQTGAIKNVSTYVRTL